MSGALRSFWSTRLNIERTLLLPNGPADLFAHIYYEPQRKDHRRGLQWLRNAPYAQAVVAEVFDETVEEDVVGSFPEYARLRAEDTYGITTQGKETSAWLSMLRKLHLANELRRLHEVTRGRPYRLVVRVRPDLMFGDDVQLDRLHPDVRPSGLMAPWTFLQSVVRRTRPPTDTLFVPIPPASGALWRMCSKPSTFEERSVHYADCGAAPRDACTPSPAAGLVGTSALCPCCEWEQHLRVGRKVCNCNGLFPQRRGRRAATRGGAAAVRNETRRTASRGHAPELSELSEGHAPWGERLLLDQLAIGTPRAMDVFAGLASALPATFARNGARGQRTLSEHGFVTERLLGSHVARAKSWLTVRPVAWLQWGVKADTGHQRDWMDPGTHRGGREAWQPPERVAARRRGQTGATGERLMR